MSGSDHLRQGSDEKTGTDVVLPVDNINETLDFFERRMGFRLNFITPADAPREVLISGHGVRIRLLDRQSFGHECRDQNIDRRRLRIDSLPPVVLPPVHPESVHVRMDDAAGWQAGRAGMLYRDLIPGRYGGRYIASHIRIPDGGPVPDNVHFHNLRFQLIYCLRGWVKLVYEDQGPPFVMHAGDCLLQPPTIRHRVLECSGPLDVIEVSCPAEHETWIDHDMSLPTSTVAAEKRFEGQLFRLDRQSECVWEPWQEPESGRTANELFCRSTGLKEASKNRVDAFELRANKPVRTSQRRQSEELMLLVGLYGECRIAIEGESEINLREGDALTIPHGESWSMSTESTRVLIVTAPRAAG